MRWVFSNIKKGKTVSTALPFFDYGLSGGKCPVSPPVPSPGGGVVQLVVTVPSLFVVAVDPVDGLDNPKIRAIINSIIFSKILK